jgi:DinB superfamily
MATLPGFVKEVFEMSERKKQIDQQFVIQNEVLSLIYQVKAARDLLLATISTVSIQQELFKPGPEEWSIANVVEHLVLAEQGGIQRLWQAAIGLERGKPVWSSPAPRRELSIEEVIERTWKVTSAGPISMRTEEKAPPSATPQGEGPLAYWRACLQACQPVLEGLGTVLGGLELAQVIVPHVISGPLDARQRLQFLRWHLDHHRQQIEDIKAYPDFPMEKAESSSC